MTLEVLNTQPALHSRSTSAQLILSQRADIQIRTKAQGGGWVNQLEATVPADKVWTAQVSVYVLETEPTP